MQVKRFVNDLLDFAISVVFFVGFIVVLNDDCSFFVNVSMLTGLNLVLRYNGHVVLANDAKREIVLDGLKY